MVKLAARARLAAMYPTRQYVDAGGLVAYGASLDDLLRRVTGYVARILKGAQPADLPVEQPSVFELVVNLKTARTLGRYMAPSVRSRADRLVE
jgi:putative ABC transport system substrate-binding protein